MPDLGDNGDVIIILPIWVYELHTIYFNTLFSATFDEIEVYYDSNIDLPTTVNRTGYLFKGWYRNAVGGTKVLWTKMPDLTLGSRNNGSISLFAQYDLIQYSIIYNMDGGTNCSNNPTEFNIESEILLQDPAKVEYTFGEWFLNASKTIGIIELNNNTGNKLIYAKWVPNIYAVNLDMQSGSGGTSSVNATYNQEMPTTVDPSKTGYVFQGYYTQPNGVGIKFYNLDMSSANIWNILESTTLYAYWTPKKHSVTLDKQGGTGGTSSVVVTYVQAMLSATAPSRTGYYFQGYYSLTNGETNYYSKYMESAKDWDIADNETLYAQWRAKEYDITLHKDGGTGRTSSVYATYASGMPSASAPYKTGYTFKGYYSSYDGGGVKYYNANMSSENNWTTANAGHLYAYWTAKTYAVTLNKQSGSGGTSSVRATYHNSMPSASAPTCTGYTFGGYWSGTNGNGTQYYNSSMGSDRYWDRNSDTTIYAKWTPITYSFK